MSGPTKGWKQRGNGIHLSFNSPFLTFCFLLFLSSHYYRPNHRSNFPFFLLFLTLCIVEKQNGYLFQVLSRHKTCARTKAAPTIDSFYRDRERENSFTHMASTTILLATKTRKLLVIGACKV